MKPPFIASSSQRTTDAINTAFLLTGGSWYRGPLVKPYLYVTTTAYGDTEATLLLVTTLRQVQQNGLVAKRMQVVTKMVIKWSQCAQRTP